MSTDTLPSMDHQESAYYDRLFTAIDKDNSGLLPGHDALPFLISSNLPQSTLGEVWAIADIDNNGFLTRQGWYKAARLIGWLQNGESVATEALTSRRPPFPKFAGHALPNPAPSSRLPPVTAADRTKFTRIFVGCGPSNGLVTGDKARDVFVKSKLDYEKLGQIWNLADTQQRGSLDLTDFIIGMYLIQSCMADPTLSLPLSLPPGTYEQASGGRPAPISPMSPQRTGSSLRPQHTGPISPIHPQRTGTPTRAPSILTGGPAWDVLPDAKATSDRFFAQLDTQNKGIIEGDVAVPFMLQSQLEEGILATIWDLADIKHEGKLDRDQFAVAMHLINNKLAGKDVPSVLPMSLVPPSLRNAATGPQEVLSGPSSATRDLFDLFDDPPAAPAFAPPAAAFPPPIAASFTSRSAPPPPPVRQVQSPPASDLLGEETVSVPDHSAEIGNKRNELESTERNLAGVTSSRQQLESTAQESAAQLTDLESRLKAAHTNHETETKTVAELTRRVSEQKIALQKVNSELITAESDVSALKSERAELEQALLHDKEEVRGLQRQMKELEDERTTLKTVLDRLRKESRQQKGLVTIAKKQLTTAETARDGVQKDVDTETAAAAAVPLPATPQALSPVATGVSQRSNNPFDRLGRATQPLSTVGVVGAGAAAAAGVVVAGAETLYQAAKDAVVSPSTEVPVDVGSRVQIETSEDTNVKTPPVESGPATNTLPENATAPRDSPDPFGATVEPTAADSRPIHDDVEELDAFGAQPASAGPLDAGFGDSFASPGVEPAKSTDAGADFEAAFADFDTREASATLPSDADVGDAPAAATRLDEPAELDSSDEEGGPEEVDAPSKYTSPSSRPTDAAIGSPNPLSASPSLAPPVEAPTAVVSRRSAPPPPVKSVTDELDPFAPTTRAQTLDHASDNRPFTDVEPVKSPLQIAASNVDQNPTQPRGAFDDDDFDFSDLPPATVDETAKPAAGSNFDDEFAGFDDEFATSQPPSGSDNSNLAKSYEMVSPAPKSFDEWGVPGSQSDAQGQSTFSFDDAFGGDFEPSVPPPAQQSAQPQSSVAAPPLPQRSASQAQNDDIEDVKKLCSMGFSRDLVIAAMDANGYDFQKSLNVLLAQ